MPSFLISNIYPNLNATFMNQVVHAVRLTSGHFTDNHILSSSENVIMAFNLSGLLVSVINEIERL